MVLFERTHQLQKSIRRGRLVERVNQSRIGDMPLKMRYGDRYLALLEEPRPSMRHLSAGGMWLNLVPGDEVDGVERTWDYPLLVPPLIPLIQALAEDIEGLAERVCSA